MFRRSLRDILPKTILHIWYHVFWPFFVNRVLKLYMKIVAKNVSRTYTMFVSMVAHLPDGTGSNAKNLHNFWARPEWFVPKNKGFLFGVSRHVTNLRRCFYVLERLKWWNVCSKNVNKCGTMWKQGTLLMSPWYTKIMHESDLFFLNLL